MKAAIIGVQSARPSEGVRFVTDWPEPPAEVPAEHVRLRVLASALNHLDLWVAKGVPGLTLSYPRVSGCDACGEVIGVGAGVDSSWMGRRVIVNAAQRQEEVFRPLDPPEPRTEEIIMQGEHTNGFHCERVDVPVGNVQAIGAEVAATEAAAFGLTFLTAWSMMVGKGEIRPGQWVLITGIGGGVATAALAIAKHHGCRVVVTSRHGAKLERARQLGADEVVLDGGADWSREARKKTGGRGFDLAVDSVGKATHLWCIKSLARGGTYVTPGCTSGPDAVTDLARVFWNQLRIMGSTMGTREEFAQIAALYRAGKLRPMIDRVFPAAKAQEAFARLEAGEQFGKIVLDWK
ncbi:MAG: zinc-binding dehydrogenase [Phycisphaerales bacterium]|nr:zinc-binding dehydrogenase [Phycisphaerales bacterium]